MSADLQTSRQLRLRLSFLDAGLPIATGVLVVLYLLALLDVEAAEWCE